MRPYLLSKSNEYSWSKFLKEQQMVIVHAENPNERICWEWIHVKMDMLKPSLQRKAESSWKGHCHQRKKVAMHQEFTSFIATVVLSGPIDRRLFLAFLLKSVFLRIGRRDEWRRNGRFEFHHWLFGEWRRCKFVRYVGSVSREEFYGPDNVEKANWFEHE